jgi:hypothetical protein
MSWSGTSHSESDWGNFGAPSGGGFDWGGAATSHGHFGSDGNDSYVPPKGQVPAAPVGPSAAELAAQEAARRAEAEANAARIFGLAQGAGTNYFNARGINAQTGGQFYDPLISRFEQLLGASRESLNDQNYLTEAERIAANSLDAENTAARQFLGSQVSNAFSAFNPSTMIPDTMDDNILSSILGTQRQSADDFLTRALQRGQLRQPGFDAGSAALDQQGAAAMARMQDLGMGVLEQGRGQLSNIKQDALASAGGFSIGNPFDLNNYTGRAQSAFDDFSGGLDGRIRAAIGDSSFFNPANAVNMGGSAQGVQNVGSENSALLSAMQNNRNQINQPRGVGNQGVF